MEATCPAGTFLPDQKEDPRSVAPPCMPMTALICTVYLLVYLVSGYRAACRLFSAERTVIRLWLGSVLGLCMLMWFPALAALLLSFSLSAQLAGAAAALAVGIVCSLPFTRKNSLPAPEPVRESPALLVVLPVFCLCLFLLLGHTIRPKNGGLWVGQSTYGDLSMHLGFISSIAVQKTFPPYYSICPDRLVGYPFLCESVGATFCVLGADLRSATVLTAALAFAAVLPGIYFFFEAWLKDPRKTALAFLLFLFGGGFGFAYFFDLLREHPENLSRLLTGFYETPTNLIDKNIRWVNPICDMMIPQRALLFGWALLFPCLFLLYRAGMEKRRDAFLPLGLIAGCLPLVHTHSFLALGIVSAYMFLRSLFIREGLAQLKGYLVYLVAALVLAAPQLILFTFPQGTGALRLHFNWGNLYDGYLWFYLKNLGLFFCLIPLSVLTAKKEDRAFFGGAVLILLIAEFIQFQPNTYDNNKLLFISFAFLSAMTASCLVDLGTKLFTSQKDLSGRIGVSLFGALLAFALFASGVMTVMREAVSEYQLITPEEVRAAEYIEENTEPDATFLTANNHNNFVAVLTGRNIVCGSGSFLYYHGIDYSERERALRLLYEQPETFFSALTEQYGIDYVLVGPYEWSQYDLDFSFFEKLPVFYQNDRLTLYSVG